MGLDIGAYSKVASNFLGPAEQFTDEQREQMYEDGKIVRVLTATGFEERIDGYAEGFYRRKGKSKGFRAGSYSGYNWWRRHLSLMALDTEPEDVWSDPDLYEGRPFVELISFSDCEGCIGPKTSKKLAEDFRNNLSKAEAYARANAPDNPNRPGAGSDSDDAVHPWWLENYREWLAAFELASEDGFVVFS
jgi:hypothetical protein